jgi:uncharacterized protein (DUF433 family)
MTIAQTEYKYIEIDDCNVPIIVGTTLKVIELVEAHLVYGWNTEEIHRQHPYLTMSQIYSALAYYWDYKAELDADMERRFEYAEQLRRNSGESPLTKKLQAQGLIK